MSFVKLELENFRKFSGAEFSFPDSGITLILGPNGSGKSTILEALYLLCMGRSPRDAQFSSLLHRKAGSVPSYFRVQAELSAELSARGPRSISFLLGSAVSYRNGDRAVRRTDWIGRPPVVLFSSGEMSLVGGEPALRRKFMDRILSQEDPEYLARLRRYTRTLEERNALLKFEESGPPDAQALLAMDETLSEDAEILSAARRDLIRQIMEELPDQLESLGSEHLGSRLRIELMESARGNLLGALLERRKEDLACGHTTVGPHRDDIQFLDALSTLGEKSMPLPASCTLSQGEVRILSLALKCREADRLRLHAERKTVAVGRGPDDREIASADAPPAEGLPILLLDDLFSELDARRRQAVSAFIRQYPGQVFLTSCSAPPANFLPDVRKEIIIESQLATNLSKDFPLL